jgi:hypothetical protein
MLRPFRGEEVKVAEEAYHKSKYLSGVGGGDVQYCAGLLYFDEGLAKTTSSNSLISRYIKFFESAL